MEHPILTTSTLLIICVFVYFSFLETFYAGIENLKFEILSFFPRNLSSSAINEPFDCKLIILIKLAFAVKLFRIQNTGNPEIFIWKELHLYHERRCYGVRVGWKRHSTKLIKKEIKLHCTILCELSEMSLVNQPYEIVKNDLWWSFKLMNRL